MPPGPAFGRPVNNSAKSATALSHRTETLSPGFAEFTIGPAKGRTGGSTRAAVCRIDQTSMRARSRSARLIGPLDIAWAHNVEHCFARGNQVIRDNSPVAPPPHGFSAHDRTTPRVSKFPQSAQPAAKT